LLCNAKTIRGSIISVRGVRHAFPMTQPCLLDNWFGWVIACADAGCKKMRFMTSNGLLQAAYVSHIEVLDGEDLMQGDPVRNPGLLAIVSVLGVVALGYEILSSTDHLFHFHFHRWADYLAAGLTVLAMTFAGFELRHKVGILRIRSVSRSFVGGLFWLLMASSFGVAIYALISNGSWQWLVAQLGLGLAGGIFGSLKGRMDDVDAPKQISFDEWEEETKREADNKRELERRVKIQQELERDPEYRRRMRLPMIARIRDMM
jgi:hypothetical protein